MKQKERLSKTPALHSLLGSGHSPQIHSDLSGCSADVQVFVQVLKLERIGEGIYICTVCLNKQQLLCLVRLKKYLININKQIQIHFLQRTFLLNISSRSALETLSERYVKPLIFRVTGCYGVKPDSISDSWMCSRCATGNWTVVSGSTTLCSYTAPYVANCDALCVLRTVDCGQHYIFPMLTPVYHNINI